MDIADIMLHVPANLSANDHANIERDIQGCDGMVSVHFSTKYPHMLEVAYGPLALADTNMLVIAVAPNNDLLEKFKSNLQELRARWETDRVRRCQGTDVGKPRNLAKSVTVE